MPLKNKFVCVHGHFYQPPRENPWWGAVDPEESAHPFADWNQRIASECYGPNAQSPVRDMDGRINGMADNYRRISFNFCPTLLAWLERERPGLYARIQEADRSSLRERGHGNALAQPYMHAILPLASARDKKTLVRWGMDDFRKRFQREPEGMWLPETAVDDASLEALVAQGLRFTILAPHQAARVRPAGGGPGDWKDVTAETLNPTRPYRWRSRLQPGKELAIFFYHGLLSRGVETGETVKDGETFFHKVLGRFLPDDSTQLVHLASDGEFYGHHHRHGQEALAHALARLQEEGAVLTNYGAFLDRFPPPQEVEVRQDTSWSCEHGIERWRKGCGCRSRGCPPSWSQDWRGVLRSALDWLAEGLDAFYEERAAILLKDPWAARDDYASRLTGGSVDELLKAHSRRHLRPLEARRALALLELQRQRLAMFTSCAWFFDDISGIEPVQVLKHACRALDWAGEEGRALADGFKERLKHAPSNVKKLTDGAQVLRRLVEPMRVDFKRTAAHHALLEHLQCPPGRSSPLLQARIVSVLRRSKTGPAGRNPELTWVTFELKRAADLEARTATAAVHQQDHLDLACWAVLEPAGGEPSAGLLEAFDSSDGEVFRNRLSARFGADHMTLDALLPEQRREVLRLLTPPLSRALEQSGFLRAWARAAGRLSRDEAGADDEALALLCDCRSRGLLPDQLPWAGEARARLTGCRARLARRQAFGLLR